MGYAINVRFRVLSQLDNNEGVAPYAGARIETSPSGGGTPGGSGRSLRGGAD
ncbi:hypothetical protein Ga0061061_10266, partial [Chelatococcus sambhunathii]